MLCRLCQTERHIRMRLRLLGIILLSVCSVQQGVRTRWAQGRVAISGAILGYLCRRGTLTHCCWGHPASSD